MLYHDCFVDNKDKLLFLSERQLLFLRACVNFSFLPYFVQCRHDNNLGAIPVRWMRCGAD